MSTGIQETDSFFYVAGLAIGAVRSLSVGNEALGKVTIGICAATIAINFRDRIMSHSPHLQLMQVGKEAGCTASEVLQILAGIITGLGIRSIYRASVPLHVIGGGIGAIQMVAGAFLSYYASKAHRYLIRV